MGAVPATTGRSALLSTLGPPLDSLVVGTALANPRDQSMKTHHTIVLALLGALACTTLACSDPDPASNEDTCNQLQACPAGLTAIASDLADEMVAAGDCVDVGPDQSVALAGEQACIRQGEGECAYACVTDCAQDHLCIGNGGPANGGCLACTNDAECGGCGGQG